MAEYADIVQIGARNMQNYPLLRRAGRTGKPVLLKRGMSATIEEFLLTAEYVLAEGNPNVILCERGVRSFDTHTRNVLDLAAIPVVQSLSHLPMIADPSHGTGIRSMVTAMGRAAVAAGADGLIVRSMGQPFIPRPGMRGPEYRLAPGMSAIIAANVKQRVLLARSVKGSLHRKNQAAVSSFDNSVRLMDRRQSRDASHGTIVFQVFPSSSE